MPHASPSTHTASQNLVSLYVDTCVEQGRSEMLALKGQVARHLKELLDLECDYDLLERTLQTFVERRGRTALQLAEIYAELAREETASPSERPSVRRAANEWIRANGWPTGARFIRGETSGNFVWDPLGLDRCTYFDWPYPRPTFDEICEALSVT